MGPPYHTDDDDAPSSAESDDISSSHTSDDDDDITDNKSDHDTDDDDVDIDSADDVRREGGGNDNHSTDAEVVASPICAVAENGYSPVWPFYESDEEDERLHQVAILQTVSPGPAKKIQSSSAIVMTNDDVNNHL